MKHSPVIAWVGLGSNLDDPPRQLRSALRELDALPHSRVGCHSSLYRSPPLRGPGVPEQPDYLNAVAEVHTALPADGLLQHLHAIEARHGRVRDGTRWGPRPLDLDLLLYGDQRSSNPALPHPGLTRRAFVVYPLYECAPRLVLPDGRRLTEVLAVCPRDGLQRLEKL